MKAVCFYKAQAPDYGHGVPIKPCYEAFHPATEMKC